MPNFELETSPIWQDVKKIIGSGKKPVKHEYRGQLHTEKQDITVMKIISIDTVRDYLNHVGDHLEIRFQMPLGDYMNCLYPFRANLEFSIKKITLTEGADKKEPNSKITVTRYKAAFPMDLNKIPTATDIENYDHNTLNNVDLVTVTLQLLNRSLEPLRIKTVPGSVFRDVTAEQVIRSVLFGESIKVLVDGKPSIDGLDLVDPDNPDKRDHYVFPSGIRITSVPTYLQEKVGGVYSAGIGTYLQTYNDKQLWFVYPLFNTTRFDKEKRDKAIIYAISSDRFPNLDRTYQKDGSVLTLVASANKTYRDSADVDFMNSGSGFRMADARSFMTKPVEMTADGPKAKRTNLNHEVATEDRKDGLNFAPTATKKVSSNPFFEYSRILGMQLSRVDFVWENSDPDLLYPGMPCKYIYLDNNKPVELKGTIVFAHTVSATQSNGVGNNIFKNITTIVAMVDQVTIEQKFKSRKLPENPSIGVF